MADLQRAHFLLWRAWRQVSWNLSEEQAWRALLDAGYTPDAIVEALQALERQGDLSVHYNADLPFYALRRDDLGFPALKGAW